MSDIKLIIWCSRVWWEHGRTITKCLGFFFLWKYDCKQRLWIKSYYNACDAVMVNVNHELRRETHHRSSKWNAIRARATAPIFDCERLFLTQLNSHESVGGRFQVAERRRRFNANTQLCDLIHWSLGCRHRNQFFKHILMRKIHWLSVIAIVRCVSNIFPDDELPLEITD